MPFVSSYDKSFSGTSSFPRSYSSSYSSYERKSSWDRPSSMYSNSDTSYTKPSYSTPSSYMASRSTNSLNSSSTLPSSSAYSWRDNPRFGDESKPSYSWRDSLKSDKPKFDDSKYTKFSEEPSSKLGSWRDSLKTEKQSFVDKHSVETKPSYSWRDSLKKDQSNGGYEAPHKIVDHQDEDRLSRTLERKSSKKDILAGYESHLQRTLDRSSNISERIEQTLSKHNAGSIQDQSSWRTRERSSTRTDSVDVTKCKYLQDRGTSPDLDSVKVSRVGRDSEPYSVRLTKYVNPIKIDVGLQTDPFYLKDRSDKDSDTFDYFDHVKKTMKYISNNPAEKKKLDERIELFNAGEKEEKYTYKKAAMTGFLPNQEPATKQIEIRKEKSVEPRKPFRYSDTLQSVDKRLGCAIQDEHQTNSTNSVSDTSNTAVNGFENGYSSKKKKSSVMDDPLNYLESMNLDSEDEKPPDKGADKHVKTEEEDEEEEEESEYEEESEAVLSGKLEIGLQLENNVNENNHSQEKEELEKVDSAKTFIGTTIDIDDLLSRTSHFFSYDGSPAEFDKDQDTDQNRIEENHVTDEATNSSKHKTSKCLDDTPWWEKYKDDSVNHENKTSVEAPEDADEGDEADEYEEDEEGDEDEDEDEEEEDGDWEYYYSEDEEGPEEEKLEPAMVDNVQTKDEKREWIVDCIKQIIPCVPVIPAKKDDDSEESDGQEYGNFDDMKVMDNLYSEHHGYRDWLKDVAVEISKDPLLSTAESNVIDYDQGQEKQDAADDDKAKSKAKSIVDKLNKDSGESSLKQVLFSLKSLFQSESNLVYEFVEQGGLDKLVELGMNEEESQLKNFVLRALGQLMLYVDGMKGVMENISAIELLYKLISSENKLVVKTAIKLLLVFIDYNESNYLILLQAIGNVATLQEETPWKYLVNLMSDNENFDPELCSFALTLVNKTLYEIDDQNTFYDQTDFLEELGIEKITDMTSDDSIPNTLLEEIQLYNVALKQEDGDQVTEEDISALYQDSSLRLRTSLRTKSKSIKPRKSLRYKIAQVKNAEVDNMGDIEEVGFNDLKRILAKNGLPVSPSGDSLNQLSGDLSGFLLKAKDAFIAKISKGETGSPVPPDSPHSDEREGEAQWKQIEASTNRPLIICDLDFTDLKFEEEVQQEVGQSSGIPVPPPLPPSAPPEAPPPPGAPAPPPPLPTFTKDKPVTSNFKKTKKTIKLFWRELRCKPEGSTTVWDELHPISVDHKVLEYLFESRGKESAVKESSKLQAVPMREIVVLDNKRSNFINIGMTKLPPPRIIKESVMKMDSSIINKEGIEKLLTMLPSEEEISKIEEAQELYPDLPLGTAEQFLITLSSISGLESRLRLWAFKLDFVVVEREICEPLGDLKQGLDNLRNSLTFNAILSVILEIGNFLNGTSSRGFQIDYLAKVPEVKDTVHKHSMLYHLTFWLLECIPNLSDLYSEIGPVTRASKTDFEELSSTLARMEEECKNAWDYLKIITKFDTVHGEAEQVLKNKISEFLTDAAERIIVMQKIYKIMRKNFQEFLTWLGVPKSQTHEYKVHHVCKIISEFALEFRTSRERAQQTLKLKKEAKERNRSRAKLHELVKNSSKNELNLLLGEMDHPRKKKKHREHRRRREDDGGEGKERREHRRRREDGEHRERRRRDRDDGAGSRADGALSRCEGDQMEAEAEVEGVVRTEQRRRRRREEVLSVEPGSVQPEDKERRRKKKVPRNVSEQTVQLINGQSIPENEVDAGLFQSLMDMGRSKLRRNGERRRSTKVRETSLGSELMRSRTRENADRLVHPEE